MKKTQIVQSQDDWATRRRLAKIGRGKVDEGGKRRLAEVQNERKLGDFLGHASTTIPDLDLDRHASASEKRSVEKSLRKDFLGWAISSVAERLRKMASILKKLWRQK